MSQATPKIIPPPGPPTTVKPLPSKRFQAIASLSPQEPDQGSPALAGLGKILGRIMVENEVVFLSVRWAPTAKHWVVQASLVDAWAAPGRPVRIVADTTVDMTSVGCELLALACKEEMESWLPGLG